ncbi:14873_t:CDS:1, partial [Funneliformis geosporum]
FNPLVRCNKMREKMTGRFHPVPVNNPYNANVPINNEAEFLNWLQGKYQEVMVGTNQDALRSLMNENFPQWIQQILMRKESRHIR